MNSSHGNLVAQPADKEWSWWGRVIFYVSDVDDLYARAMAEGLRPETVPRDAEWGERYFHITDPDGHELRLLAPVKKHETERAIKTHRTPHVVSG